MSFDYAGMAADASSLIAEFGQDITLTHVVQGTYDPATGGVVNTTTNQTAKAVELEYSNYETGGTLIIAGDKRLLVSVSGITAPMIDDNCTVGGVVYTIKNVKPLSPAGIVLYYDIQLRK
jgi:hypothetical protein